MALSIIVDVQPSNQTVYELGTATFSTAASASKPSATLTYQWQRSASNSNSNYINVAGATGGAYQYSPTLTDNGKWFKCALSAAEGSDTAGVYTNGVQVSALADIYKAFAAGGEAGVNRRTRLSGLGYI